ncbi:MAG: cobalamin-binding protein [Planctomycetes bacterium]|nr:cobalamin-binding protein [Planctomycetota bacterium]
MATREKIRFAALIVLAIIGCGRCPSDQEADPSNPYPTDATGVQLQLENVPQRMVSLSPAITESLYLLDVSDRLVGVTVYCNYPPEAQEKERVGTVLSPCIEKIVQLSPDLILATKEIGKAKTVSKLRSLGLKVFVFGERTTFSDICREFVLLGRLVGKGSKASLIAERAIEDVSTICRAASTKPRRKVFWQIGARPLVTVAKGTFVNEMISSAGGINIAQDSQVRYPRYSLEEVVRQDPDLIIIVTMGEATEQAKLRWETFGSLKAVRGNRIYVIDAHDVCAPSPVSFVEGLRKVAAFIHPN